MGVANKEMVTVVIVPLQSIMEEQADRFNNLGLSAIYINSLRIHVNEFIAKFFLTIYLRQS